jgi:hypothetical protein
LPPGCVLSGYFKVKRISKYSKSSLKTPSSILSFQTSSTSSMPSFNPHFCKVFEIAEIRISQGVAQVKS